MNIRKAELQDAESFILIKQKLKLNAAHQNSGQGGFLLGTDLQTYQYFISKADCFVAEINSEIIGFAIALPDDLIRKSELWLKRNQVVWKFSLETIERSKLAYIEQLACLPQHHFSAFSLASHLIYFLFNCGVENIITTTVVKPVLNKAALPFIFAVGGIHVGEINEYYPEYGAITSDIYCISREAFLKHEEKLKHKYHLHHLIQLNHF